MNFQYDDQYLPLVLRNRHRALEEREARNQSQKYKSSLKEDEELQVALALSRASIHDGDDFKEEEDFEEARLVNLRLHLQKEESELELALALSVSELQSQSQNANSEHQHGIAEEQREQIEDVSQEQYDDVLWSYTDEPIDLIQFSDEYGDFEDELPDAYKNYRRVPTMFSENEMWPRRAVDRQRRELRATWVTEPVREWTDRHCESQRCLICLSNVATRMALPCAHRLSCRPCVSELVDNPVHYSVTSANGEISDTDIRLPIQCFVCRAIIGQIVTVR